MGIRNLAVGLAASGACVFLGALLLGQQQGTQRLGELQEEADHASTGCVACHGQTDSSRCTRPERCVWGVQIAMAGMRA